MAMAIRVGKGEYLIYIPSVVVWPSTVVGHHDLALWWGYGRH